LSAGRKLGRLEDFCEVANEVASEFENCEGCTAVDDILIAADTWTITLGQKEISLGPVGSAIFNMLALNAGQVISRDRLRRAVSDVIDPSNLDAHIWTLRSRLGVKNRKRIQTVKGVGYMYISSGKGAEDEAVRGGTVQKDT
jgi:DNA-binding response OmpR family regulator